MFFLSCNNFREYKIRKKAIKAHIIYMYANGIGIKLQEVQIGHL